LEFWFELDDHPGTRSPLAEDNRAVDKRISVDMGLYKMGYSSTSASGLKNKPTGPGFIWGKDKMMNIAAV